MLAIGHGFGFLDPSGAFEQIADIPQRAIESRMNDGNCDAAGRFWAGTMGLGEEPEAGALYRLDPDLTVTRVLETVSESNGIDWSPDDRLMYHVDSIDRRVDVYEFDLASGSLGDRQQLIAFEDTIPDGLTVDTDGNLWVACWGGYAVRKFSADGALLETVSLPTANITCPVFGGPALDRMFITSARTHAVARAAERGARSGRAVRMRAGRARPPTADLRRLTAAGGRAGLADDRDPRSAGR